MRNECTDKVTKFGGAARRRFHAIREKPEGGGLLEPPPPEIGLIAFLMIHKQMTFLGQDRLELAFYVQSKYR